MSEELCTDYAEIKYIDEDNVVLLAWKKRALL